MRAYPWRAIIPAMIGAAVGGMLFLQEINQRIGPPASLAWGAAPAITMVEAGDAFIVRIHAAPGRYCPAVVTRFLWKWHTSPSGKRERMYISLGAPAAPISDPVREATFLLSLSVPENLTPGEYYYSATLTTWCGMWGAFFGDNMTTSTPDVPITILPKG